MEFIRIFDNEKEARAIADKRKQAKIDQERKATSAMNLDDLAAGDLMIINAHHGKVRAMHIDFRRTDKSSLALLFFQKFFIHQLGNCVSHRNPADLIGLAQFQFRWYFLIWF